NSAAQVSGGGICNDADGARLEVLNTTFSANSAPLGGAIWNGAVGGAATTEIGGTILNAGPMGGSIVNDSTNSVISRGYNLSSDDGGGMLTNETDQINTDPMLGPLQDNGGPTFTHALACVSPAIDKGKNFSGAATDQ